MNKWMLRGLVFAAAMVVLRVFQGVLINAFQTSAGLISILLLVVFVIGVVLWGVVDGRSDARRNPDPDRRDDLAMIWLLAGLVAGVVSGAVAWLISMFYTGLYTGGVLQEITTFAAFTALLVFLPAILGAALGRWRVDRKAPPPAKHEGSHEGGDSDVFAAARADETQAGETDSARRHERSAAPTAVATAERESRTDAIRTRDHEAGTGESEATTDSFKLPGGEDDTDAIRTHDADQTRPDTHKRD